MHLQREKAKAKIEENSLDFFVFADPAKWMNVSEIASTPHPAELH
jgi:hypothetical protein